MVNLNLVVSYYTHIDYVPSLWSVTEHKSSSSQLKSPDASSNACFWFRKVVLISNQWFVLIHQFYKPILSVKLPLLCMVSLRAFSPDLWLNMIELLVYDAETNWFWNWRETVRRLAVGISTEWVELSTSGSIDWVWLWLFLVIIFLWLRPFYYFTQLIVERCLITAGLRPLALDGTVLGSFFWNKDQFRNLFNLVLKMEKEPPPFCKFSINSFTPIEASLFWRLDSSGTSRPPRHEASSTMAGPICVKTMSAAWTISPGSSEKQWTTEL